MIPRGSCPECAPIEADPDRARLGRFVLRDPGSAWRRVLPIFSGCVVLRASYDFARGAVEYVALSDFFDEVPIPTPERDLPEYEWTIHHCRRTGRFTHLEAERLG